MGLQAIQGIGPATVKKLNSAGIKSLDDMRQMDVATIAEKTGVAEARLREWKTEAKLIKVLDDVKGIGPATKKKLQAAGIHNLDDLAKATVHEVAHATSIAQERLKEWQKQARKLVKDAETYMEREAPKVKAAATRAQSQAKKTGAAVKKRASDAAVQVRQTSETMAHEVRDRVEAMRGDASSATGTNGTVGTNGQKPTFLSRLKRLFVPRQQ